MKASTPSLILFFVTSILACVFKLLGWGTLVLITKSIVIPSLFIYYLVSNNYKITFLKTLIFLLFFVRDVFVMLSISESAMGSFMSVLAVYVLLIYLALKNFNQLKFNFKDSFYITVLILGIATICYSVLNLKLENLELDFYMYVFFGVVLSVLSVITILNYAKDSTHAFFSALVMCVNFIISDIFFVLYKFYLYNHLLTIISLITQFLSYFFMVRYFLEKDMKAENLDDY